MELRSSRLVLRPWAPGDEQALVRHANDRSVWRNLTDRFPHPYGREHALAWIQRVVEQGEPPLNFAILAGGEPVGGAGLERKQDLARLTAEVGYWLGRRVWGRGYATEALRAITEHAFSSFDFERLEASVLDWNPASRRVLEKAGYALEARLQRGALKDGRLVDTWLYARLRPR